MKITIDTNKSMLDIEGKEVSLYSNEAFQVLSKYWLKVGWNQKYSYTFSWMGRPIIQIPEDMIRYQEVVYQIKPDVIIETGIAHGGSLIYSASLLKAIGRGRVIGIDIEIRPHNRQAIESHELFELITLFEGSSTDLETFEKIQAELKPTDRVLVVLDSNHTQEHVKKELELYHPLVSLNSYLVVTDGFMKELADAPRSGGVDWITNNPYTAAQEFLESHPQFILKQPPWPFNESTLSENITHWPGAWLKKIR